MRLLFLLLVAMLFSGCTRPSTDVHPAGLNGGVSFGYGIYKKITIEGTTCIVGISSGGKPITLSCDWVKQCTELDRN